MDIKIIHDQKNRKFTTSVDNSECYLNYNFTRENVMDFYFTYVPGELRGKGIAGKLVEEGLKYAWENNLSVIPSCSYVSSYVRRNDKYESIIVEE
jgi:predicted GNAT family acetyltransferase